MSNPHNHSVEPEVDGGELWFRVQCDCGLHFRTTDRGKAERMVLLIDADDVLQTIKVDGR